jgi:hypothetical protein
VKLVGTALAVASLLPLASASSAVAPRTTEPGVVYIVRVNFTDKKISVSHGRYVRGAVIRYHIRNRGTKPYSFRMWHDKTGVIRPRRTDSLFINWNYRGKYRYETLYRGKPTGVKGFITIF